MKSALSGCLKCALRSRAPSEPPIPETTFTRASQVSARICRSLPGQEKRTFYLAYIVTKKYADAISIFTFPFLSRKKQGYGAEVGSRAKEKNKKIRRRVPNHSDDLCTVSSGQTGPNSRGLEGPPAQSDEESPDGSEDGSGRSDDLRSVIPGPDSAAPPAGSDLLITIRPFHGLPFFTVGQARIHPGNKTVVFLLSAFWLGLPGLRQVGDCKDWDAGFSGVSLRICTGKVYCFLYTKYKNSVFVTY